MYRILPARLRFVGEPADDGGGDGQDPKDQQDPAPEADEKDEKSEKDDDGFDAAAALEKIRKANSENAALRKRTKEAEAKAASAADKDRTIADLTAENLRLKTGTKLGLPDWLIDRLRGTTEEEITKDAEALLERVSGKKPPTQRPKEALRGGGDPAEEPDETDPRKLAARIPRT